jgi:hypothetical protein
MWHAVGFLWSRRHHSEESEEKRNAVLMCGNWHKNCPPMYVCTGCAPVMSLTLHKTCSYCCWYFLKRKYNVGEAAFTSVCAFVCMCAHFCVCVCVCMCACICVHVCLLHLLTARQPVQRSNVTECYLIPFPVTSVAYKRQARHSFCHFQ